MSGNPLTKLDLFLFPRRVQGDGKAKSDPLYTLCPAIIAAGHQAGLPGTIRA
ncbi:MAG: hypothetical protein ACI8S3_002770, partial [Alphaproteobacteria bacterium]